MCCPGTLLSSKDAKVAMSRPDHTPLGLAEMDAAHDEFAGCLQALARAPAGCHQAALAALIEHCRAHFAAEQQLMEQGDFPAAACHVAEHEAVLASLREVSAITAVDTATAVTARLVVALQDWFPAHVDHLDSALAHWVVKRRHGAVPVVVQRGVASNFPKVLSTSRHGQEHAVAGSA